MTGQELRAKLLFTNKQITEIAKLMGISHQSLSQAMKSQDVKTGLIEKLSAVLNLPLAYFYEEPRKEETHAMNGEILRRKIKDSGFSITEIARRIGQTRPNLSQALTVKDVKSGLLEEISSALKVPVSSLYEEDAPCHYADETETVAVLRERIREMQQLLDAKECTIKAYERILGVNNQATLPIKH